MVARADPSVGPDKAVKRCLSRRRQNNVGADRVSIDPACKGKIIDVHMLARSYLAAGNTDCMPQFEHRRALGNRLDRKFVPGGHGGKERDTIEDIARVERL